MRILPVALVSHRADDAELVDKAMRASSVTHAHPRSKVTCALYVLIAKRLLCGERNRSEAMDDTFRVAGHVLAGPEAIELEFLRDFPNRTGSGYVVDSFWSAWEAFAAAGSYRAAIERAIAYGDDTDTTACLAGGLAGIYWGLRDIPSEWLNGMRGHDIVHPIAIRLLRQTQNP